MSGPSRIVSQRWIEYANQSTTRRIAYLTVFPRSLFHEEILSLAASNHRLWIASLRRGIDQGVYRPSIAPNVAYELIKDGLWLTGRWFRPTPEYTLADLSVECVEFYLNALMPKQSPP